MYVNSRFIAIAPMTVPHKMEDKFQESEPQAQTSSAHAGLGWELRGRSRHDACRLPFLKGQACANVTIDGKLSWFPWHLAADDPFAGALSFTNRALA